MAVELVVIGSSWGGLTALRHLLGGLPEDFATPIVVGQHRGAGSTEEVLADVLVRDTGRPVSDAEDKQRILPGHVHLAPPDYHLLVEAGSFALSLEGPVHHSRPSIDVLFQSAADVYGPRLAGVVLTGANDDGAQGVVRISERGGYVIAQDPAAAERAEMPAAACATGMVDEVLPLDRIASRLVEVCERYEGSTSLAT